MADLSSKVENLDLGNVAQFAAKKPSGSKGMKVPIQTNVAKMELGKNIAYFKYDVSIIGKITKKDGTEAEKEITRMVRDDSVQQLRKAACVAVYKAALAAGGKTFDANTTFYDRAKCLFSLNRLDLGGGEKTMTVTVAIPDCDIKKWDFKIKQCADSFQVTTNDLGKVVNANLSMQDKTLLEALNLICSKAALLKPEDFITYGTGTHYLLEPKKWGFKDSDTPSLPDGKKTMIAVAKKVSVLEGEDKKPTAYLTTEVKKSSVHISEPLANKIQAYSLMNRQFSSQAVKANLRQLKSLLRGLAVYPEYAKRNVFNINGFTENTPRTFFFEAKGKKISVETYFKTEKNITLKFPDMPMVVGYTRGQEIPYPVEVLIVAPHQRVTNSQTTPDEMQIAIKASATNPLERLRQTENMKDAMQLNSANQDLLKSGIKVADKMAVVPGRVLPDPELVYGNEVKVKPMGHCKWRADRTRFIRPAVVKSWWLVCNLASNERRASVETVNNFGERLVRLAKEKGINIADKVVKVINPTIGGVDEIFAQANNEKVPYLIFVSTDNLKFHDHIKRLEVEYQILTQEVKASNAIKVAEGSHANTLENIVNKINEKNGGLGYSVKMAEGWIMDPNKIFIGLEMTHPAPLSAAEQKRGVNYNTPSVLGFSANCGRHLQQYLGDYLYVEPRKTDPMGEKIAEIMPRILKDMRASREKQPCPPPNHIIIYFHGISEGQYGEIATTYKKYLRKGLDGLSEKYKPLVTLIAVSKDHSERFYNEKITGNKAAEQNIQPGTVVDQVVVNPCINEFYLTSHSAFQGTAKSPKYTVIFDDSNSSMDAIEGTTHGLCYLHEIVTATVSLPAPLIVADRCAKRGAKVFHDSQHSTAGQLNMPLLNETLTNNGKRLSKVRYNA